MSLQEVIEGVNALRLCVIHVPCIFMSIASILGFVSADLSVSGHQYLFRLHKDNELELAASIFAQRIPTTVRVSISIVYTVLDLMSNIKACCKKRTLILTFFKYLSTYLTSLEI